MKLINRTNNTIISENVMVANTFLKRFKGLMFSKELPDENSLLIVPCNEIHTFNMKYSIDVLYLDKNNNILHIDEEMKPGKVGKHVKKAVSVVELPSGKAKERGVEAGQAVEFIDD